MKEQNWNTFSRTFSNRNIYAWYKNYERKKFEISRLRVSRDPCLDELLLTRHLLVWIMQLYQYKLKFPIFKDFLKNVIQ